MNRILVLALLFIVLLQSCKVSYSFSGASTGNLETVSVQYFVDRSNLAPPNLPQIVTDELKDMIQSQTKLTLINGLAEANFEGEVRIYDGQRPVAISGDDVASLNRFTIAVKVKYTNSLDPDLDFEETFSQYQDYDSKMSFQNVENELSEDIVKQIIEDIFNRAFVNW
ncbi:MAG: LptE family protein [Bacteroidales bacterium]|nr:LptE family protein [Bacteroidales bacterium]